MKGSSRASSRGAWKPGAAPPRGAGASAGARAAGRRGKALLCTHGSGARRRRGRTGGGRVLRHSDLPGFPWPGGSCNGGSQPASAFLPASREEITDPPLSQDSELPAPARFLQIAKFQCPPPSQPQPRERSALLPPAPRQFQLQASQELFFLLQDSKKQPLGKEYAIAFTSCISQGPSSAGSSRSTSGIPLASLSRVGHSSSHRWCSS
ncbi:uncharacterized protein LOC130849275 [Hippopotamus amphibius kiboko]|uniref:uncharacterized protein LOC130849275 n=1 Tax=Hippopotamus amphibius kiboko TaxID=575201 RepID=UPI00259773D9|nr:uncharacterized protein LOC130849275 [Hippopotamus amphibius kiboko]